MKAGLILLLIITILGCNIKHNDLTKDFYSLDEGHWYLLDYKKDSVMGSSLLKGFETFSKPFNKDITIALLDTEIDLEHLALKNTIWQNPNEFSNGIDDDHNGYIDDLNGWNFLGSVNGESVLFQKHESARLINSLKSHKKVLDKDSSSYEFKLYLKVNEYVKKKKEEAATVLKQTPIIINAYRQELKNPVLPTDEKITIELLDSLIEKNLIQKEAVNYIYASRTYGMVLKDLVEDSIRYENRLQRLYNLDYDDRSLVGDNPHNFNDSIYGSNLLNNNTSELWHGTQVAGILADQGLHPSSIKIMPLSITSNGNGYDKDIYLAMKYAIENGAKIINLCTGKIFTLNEERFDEILKYAEERDVLIVTSAGNTNRNLDLEENPYYPDDIKSGKEFVSNFIRVGASGKYLNTSLKTSFSSYGKKNVDLFAPGIEIKTTSSKDKSGYTITEGTSLATPLVSKIAALLFSQYPSLTAPEVKKILMESSVKYDILVDVPTKENPEQQIPFSELSKSGGIVNAYNAMLMAEEYVTNKK